MKPTTLRLFVIFCLIVSGAQLRAGEITSAEVKHKGNDYWLNLTMELEVGQEGMLAVLTDHENYRQLSEVMLESSVIAGAPENQTRRRLVVKTCVAFFCFEVTMVEDVEQFADGRIVATMLPDASDFDYGRTEWHVIPLGPGQSKLDYSFHLQPGFWIPPAIGPFFLKRKLIREAEKSILRMEALAKGADSTNS